MPARGRRAAAWNFNKPQNILLVKWRRAVQLSSSNWAILYDYGQLQIRVSFMHSAKVQNLQSGCGFSPIYIPTRRSTYMQLYQLVKVNGAWNLLELWKSKLLEHILDLTSSQQMWLYCAAKVVSMIYCTVLLRLIL